MPTLTISGPTAAKISLLLKTSILLSVAAAAISARLFSVIRFESIIHEFDPWFNFRATKYLVSHSFYQFLNWFDDRSWYPLGRVTGGTLYPGLMVTSGLIHYVLSALGLPLDIRNICVLLAPAFSGLTAYATYLFTCEIADSSTALLSAAFMAIAPGYISRSVAGSYDNEAIAIFLLMFTFFLWLKAMKRGSVFWAAMCAGFYFYMVAAWGGYVFITNMIPLHVFVLVCMGRYSSKLYVAYCTWYAVGTAASMQIPFVGFLPIRSNDHMAALGVFGLLQLAAAADWLRAHVPPRQFRSVLLGSAAAIAAAGIGGLAALTYAGLIAPWTGRFYSLWDTGYAKVHIPIIASVSEHQPTAWPAFFFDTQMLIWLFPAGVYLLFAELTDAQVFVVLYAVLCSYFAGVMVRLMLTLTPVICVCAAVALGKLFAIYMDLSGTKTGNSVSWPSLLARGSVVLSFVAYLFIFVQHCTWVTANAYSSPSVVLSSRAADGSPVIIDDFREAYYWLRMNTVPEARVMAWWDYGYQIGGMADRTTLVDNNTWNNTHIATVGRAMSSSEEAAYPILQQHDVDYVLVVFGGLLGYSGDDMNKFLWMVRIAEGIWPEEVKERNFFTPRGEYRVDSGATKTMKESLMYKMSYYRFSEIFGTGKGGMDRVRQQTIPAEPIELKSLEEAYTTENWIVRVYKVKKPDELGRDFTAQMKFDTEAGKKRKKVKKPAVVELRE